MNTHSGNASDKNTIPEAIKSFKSVLRPESKVYYIADSSFLLLGRQYYQEGLPYFFCRDNQ